MKDEIQLWNYEGSSVRTITIDNEPWFVGKDVTDVLGYSNPRDAIGKHVDELGE
ncbi:BRO-N domain-containing protein [Ruminococcus sp. CAG:330]|mgnify:CR=1 FL=1|uniref:BRO-N domain-containing protein n=1 Tax=Ruminococcus sp. CAG:330 TaxID=1262954 RepID=UPI0003363179|nr:BRO family protein [Ruminococcus sp. CAG:330]CDE12131.1 lj928 prophage antirepressor [Ruminococcus sp. CAG:330]